jgi:putative SOS response-associated peptidase YedK
MCYSAQVKQQLKALARQFGASIDYQQFELLFERRLEDKNIKVSRALEQSFMDPTSDSEARIRDLIVRFQTSQAQVWETELFRQKKRLADAERSLLTKETKKAREDVRISTDKIDWHLQKLAELKRTELNPKDERIFPMWWAPVIVNDAKAGLHITPMRYHCRPAGKPAWYDRKFDGLYNARRDSLGKFWSDLFGASHALMVMSGFYENVDRHRLERRELEPGEVAQNVVIHFSPQPAGDMFVPCLWSHWTEGTESLNSMALITDEPPPEVSAAGHDRCPIQLTYDAALAWLSPQHVSKEQLHAILDQRERPYYEHRLSAAA